MADRYLLESGAPDGYLLEDSSGVLLLEQQPGGGRVVLPLVVQRVEGERRRRGAKAHVTTLRARLWGNSGSLAASLPPLRGRVEQNGTSVVGWPSDTIPTPVGRRRHYGAIILRPVLRNIAVAGADAQTLGPLAASLTGSVVNPTGRVAAVRVVALPRRDRGAKARVWTLQARRWGNTGSLAATLGPLSGSLAGTADWVANGAVTLGALSVSAAGVVVNPIGGDLASTLGPLTMAMTDSTGGGARFFFVEC